MNHVSWGTSIHVHVEYGRVSCTDGAASGPFSRLSSLHKYK